MNSISENAVSVPASVSLLLKLALRVSSYHKDTTAAAALTRAVLHKTGPCSSLYC
jgi:hypothetical protein